MGLVLAGCGRDPGSMEAVQESRRDCLHGRRRSFAEGGRVTGLKEADGLTPL